MSMLDVFLLTYAVVMTLKYFCRRSWERPPGVLFCLI